MKKILLFVPTFLIFIASNAQCLLKEVSLAERVTSSNLIIEGKVTAISSFWNAAHNMIYTANTIEIFKIFKGDISATSIELITEGGIVDFTMIKATPSLSLQIGDIGIFTCESVKKAKGISLQKQANPRYEAYASIQGFIKYDVKQKNASDAFKKYNNIEVELYKAVLPTLEKYKEVKHFDITAQPQYKTTAGTISNFSPTTITAGTGAILTINGSGFGATQGSGTVGFKNGDDGGATYINPLASQYIAWSNTQIQVVVPSGAGTGTIKVSQGGDAISGSSLTISYAHLNVEFDLGSGPIGYQTDHINDNGLGGYTWRMNTGFDANAAAKSSFTRAFSSWICGTGINWVIGATTSINDAVSDGTNIICFDNTAPLPAGVLGVCYSYWSGCASGPNIVWYVNELDIIFDEGSNITPLTWQYGPSAPTINQYDFETVAVHELGHGHQLGHVINAGAIMHYAISNGSFNRSLGVNDDAGGDFVQAKSIVANICGPGAMTSIACPAKTWEGSISSNYDLVGNWANALIPSSTSDVIIPTGATNMPALSSTTTCNNLTLQSSSTISLNGQSLTVNGVLSSTGTITGSATSNLSLGGSSAATLNFTSSAENLNNLTINKSTITTSLTSPLNIYGTLTITAGTLALGSNNVTLKSNATATARVAATTESTPFTYSTGKFVTEKYIAGGGLASASPSKRAYRFFSHPFNAAIALNQYTQTGEIDITGSGGTANGFSVDMPSSGNAPSAFWYNTTTGNGNTVNDVNGWVAFTAANNSTNANANAFNKHQGIRMFVRGVKGQGLAGNSYTVGSPTLAASGALNIGNQIVSLSNSGAKWNFVGNPFASPVNLQNVARANVSNMVYVWRIDMGSKGQYSSAIDVATTAYNLPAYSAFFIQATGTTPTLTFEEADKVATETTNILFRDGRSATQLNIQLKSVDDVILWDETNIGLDAKYNAARIEGEDGYKVLNSEACFYSVSTDDAKLSLDRRNFIDKDVIQLGLKSNLARTYKFAVATYIGHSIAREIWLHDKLIDSWTMLSQGTEYQFTVSTDPATQGENRFELVAKSIKPMLVKQMLSVYPNPTSQIVNINYNGLNDKATTFIKMIDINGRVVKTINAGKITTINKAIDIKSFSNSVYTIEVVNGTTKQTARFIKN